MYRHTIARGIANRVRKVTLEEREFKEKPAKDVFGTLSASGAKKLQVLKVEKELPEDPDGYDKEEIDLGPRKNEYFYKYEIAKHARMGALGIRRALELFHEMKAVARICPEHRHIQPLIYACAKAGYTKRAFELYEEYLKLNGSSCIAPSVVTFLIKSCAECPFQEYGLQRLDWFMEHLKMHHKKPLNLVQWNCAIMAYGKLGQLEAASNLVTEMISQGVYPDRSTFNMLLIGCASNEIAGSTLAFRIFKRMKLYGIKPDNNTYELLLRCIRDCGMGSQELVNETLGELPAMTSLDQRLIYTKKVKSKPGDKFAEFAWTPVVTDLAKSIDTAINTSRKKETTSDMKPLRDKKTQGVVDVVESSLAKVTGGQELLSIAIDNNLPNLLSDDHLDILYKIKSIDIDKLRTRDQRLVLFGGFLGYLEMMMKDGCRPDTKVFSMILPCLAPTKESLTAYLDVSKKYSIERDLVFYDILIRRACLDWQNKDRMDVALHFLQEMQSEGIRPNISTFESLALGCHSWRQAKKFLLDIERSGFKVSNVMIRHFFEAAISRYDYFYLTRLIELSMVHHYEPTKRLIETLEEKRIDSHQIILRKEKGILPAEEVPIWLDENYIANFDSFSRTLKEWLESTKLQEEEHPWGQFYVKGGSKRQGYIEFTRDFEALLDAKHKAMKNSENFGNLAKKAGCLKDDNC